MKKQRLTRILVMFFLMTGWITVQAQYQAEVPGDNFSLEGALELFKKSESPQEFEKMLNDVDSKVNNLDLNGDGYIDYIRVIDMKKKRVHAFIMQAVVSEVESQDIAVITLEKLANGKAVLQIIGDEDIYGIETIIEPTREVYTNAGYSSSRAVVNVWAWPSVRYIYGPYYSAWVSPWGWHYRPHWWHTWRPVAYYDYHPYWRPYRHHYSVCHTHRVVYAHHIYRPHRTTSVVVQKRHNDRIVHYRSTRIDNNGRYQASRNRSSDRQINTSVRYDANGRIRSGSNQRLSTRSSTNTRNLQRGTEDKRSNSRIQDSYSAKNRSASEVRSGSSNSQQRSSEVNRSTSSNRLSGTSNGSTVTPQRKSSASKTNRSISSGSSNAQRYERGSSANTAPKRSYSGSSSNTQRSSTSPNVQRSNGRSSGSSNVQRYSSGSSKSNSNIKRSAGSSNVKQSSGSSNARRSSGSSSINRSSGSSKVQRSSGGSSVQRSSGKSSGSSSSSRSSSSSKKSRGRQ